MQFPIFKQFSLLDPSESITSDGVEQYDDFNYYPD